jgi:sirohydrochlorin ferrochelatase
MRPSSGLLLAGHGTRDPRGLAEFESVARQVAALMTDMPVEACYLELADPDIATGVKRLVARGVRRIVVAPLLLFSAGHAKRDIPAAVEEAVRSQELGVSDQESGVTVEYVGALECHEKIVELSTQRYAEALKGRTATASDQTLLVLVGRGSSDAEAINAMRRFSVLRAERSGVKEVEVSFVAVAKPTVAEALEKAARSSFRRVVVQPHLLFHGEVLSAIETAVRDQATQEQEVHRKEWIVTEHLGAAPLVAEAVVEMVRDAMRNRARQ